MNEKEIIQNIKKSVKKTDPTAEVYLFGSRAKGNPHEQSDWDILILVDRLKITNETRYTKPFLKKVFNYEYWK
jgi:predicted nucleotidyltransferase